MRRQGADTLISSDSASLAPIEELCGLETASLGHQGEADEWSAAGKLPDVERRCPKAAGISHLTSGRGPLNALDPCQDRNLPPRHQLLLLTATSNGRLLSKVPGRILTSCNAWSPGAFPLGG